MPVTEFPEKRFKLMMEVQVYAPFHLAQLVLPSMQQRKQGWIVNISSGAGLHPKQPYAQRGRGGTVYGMCKAALERFTTGLASEVYDDNIAVNVVSPGLVETPGTLLHGLVNDQTRARVQPIEYIAEAVFRLASGDPKTLTGRRASRSPPRTGRPPPSSSIRSGRGRIPSCCSSWMRPPSARSCATWPGGSPRSATM
jgi:citronellol/citronellal dehydrogenase